MVGVPILPDGGTSGSARFSRLLYAPRGVTFDAMTQRLYVAEEHATRVITITANDQSCPPTCQIAGDFEDTL